MLSRVAERMYWFGRYMERIENTARLISVNTNLVLDLPRVKHIWSSLISITGYEENFSTRFSNQDERNVIKFLLTDERCSIMSSVRLARENARPTREIMPREAWVKINKLYLHLEKNLPKALKREGRHQLLSEIVSYCQELNGYLYSCMSVNEAYNFMRIGTNLERADMTSRILDVGCLNLLNTEYPEIREYENILWMNVLMSLTAYQMYRQHVDDAINGEDVAEFLLKDEKFPKAVAHCLADINESFTLLPNPDEPLRAVTHAQRVIRGCDVPHLLSSEELHGFIDEVQADLGGIHNQLSGAWFDFTSSP